MTVSTDVAIMHNTTLDRLIRNLANLQESLNNIPVEARLPAVISIIETLNTLPIIETLDEIAIRQQELQALAEIEKITDGFTTEIAVALPDIETMLTATKQQVEINYPGIPNKLIGVTFDDRDNAVKATYRVKDTQNPEEL